QNSTFKIHNFIKFSLRLSKHIHFVKRYGINYNTPTLKLTLGKYTLDLSEKTYIMGILNVTPDSFSDGGLYLEPKKAIEQSFKMKEEGADIIDIGGQSTRPGSTPVSEKEELKRILPVLKALAGRIKLPISIDTYSSRVAEECLKEGANMINDISGLRFSPNMAEVIARFNAGCVIMHIKGRPKDMQNNPTYQDLFSEIMAYLREGIKIAEGSGISQIIIDPGIGFGKTLPHNLKIIKGLNRFKALKKPILIGVSRKSFIGQILNLPTSERFEGTLAAVCYSILKGANIVRVHDVAGVKRAIDVIDAIKIKACV
ncbi:MAG: dihydropteroate synthase, partial [bacterium]